MGMKGSAWASDRKNPGHPVGKLGDLLIFCRTK